jgi:GTP cyclohydrolase-4
MEKKAIQEEKPKVSLRLTRVGIKNLKTLLKVARDGHEMRFIPQIDIYVDLPQEKKGIHMSRLVESITEVVEEEAEFKHNSLELIALHILESLKKRHKYSSAEVYLKTDLAVYAQTPVSKKRSIEVHEIGLRIVKKEGSLVKHLNVTVMGNTACPHSLANTGTPHIQRAYAFLEVETTFNNTITFEELIDICENSFSSRVYTLLKTEDESEIVSHMYGNPLFVEDVCRNILHMSQTCISHAKVVAKCISEESIHRHDVYAEGYVET